MANDQTELKLRAKDHAVSLYSPLLGLLGLSSMVLLGVVIFLFLQHLNSERLYLESTLDRIDDRHSQVSQQRIDRCHSVSEAGIAAQTKTADALMEVTSALSANSKVLERVETLLERHNNRLDDMDRSGR